MSGVSTASEAQSLAPTRCASRDAHAASHRCRIRWDAPPPTTERHLRTRALAVLHVVDSPIANASVGLSGVTSALLERFGVHFGHLLAVSVIKPYAARREWVSPDRCRSLQGKWVNRRKETPWSTISSYRARLGRSLSAAPPSRTFGKSRVWRESTTSSRSASPTRIGA